MKKEIKDIIKKEIETKELNLKIFNIVKEHVKKYEGKSYTRRYLPDLDQAISSVFGSAIFKYNGSSLNTDLTWKSIDLNLTLVTGYRYSYQLYYDSQEYFTLDEFDRLNKCWSLDGERIEKLKELLSDKEVVNELAKNIKAINKANEVLSELFQYGTLASGIEYSVGELIDVKLNKYPERRK